MPKLNGKLTKNSVFEVSVVKTSQVRCFLVPMDKEHLVDCTKYNELGQY